MANPTIGYITCPFTGEKDCDVRRYSTGKKSLYYVSQAGKITPNLPAGQAYMKANTKFIGENAEPLKPVNDKKPDFETVNGAEEKQKDNNEPKGLFGFLISDE